MPTDLQTLINAIPTAQDGHVITPDYHNTTRAAIVELAARAGGVAPSSSGTRTYAPVFLAVNTSTPTWVPGIGMATRPDPAASNSADGWFPVTLPDNARSVSMKVVGRKFVSNAGALSLRVFLRRKSLADPTHDEPLININLKDINGEPFSQPGRADPQTVIDNSQFQYYVRASMSFAPSDLQIDLYSFQFTWSLG